MEILIFIVAIALAAFLVRNLLAFTEPSGLSRRWQNVNDVVRRPCESCRSELQTGRGFRCQLELPVTAGGADALAAS